MSRRIYKFTREQDARAVAVAFNTVYPSYDHRPIRAKYTRTWRLGLYCRASGAFLQWAQQ